MKDPKVVELVKKLKDNLTNINSVYQKLDAQNVWVDLQKKEKGKGWEIRHLEQKVKYQQIITKEGYGKNENVYVL